MYENNETRQEKQGTAAAAKRPCLAGSIWPVWSLPAHISLGTGQCYPNFRPGLTSLIGLRPVLRPQLVPQSPGPVRDFVWPRRNPDSIIKPDFGALPYQSTKIPFLSTSCFEVFSTTFFSLEMPESEKVVIKYYNTYMSLVLILNPCKVVMLLLA